jgi:hypothetical protein
MTVVPSGSKLTFLVTMSDMPNTTTMHYFRESLRKALIACQMKGTCCDDYVRQVYDNQRAKKIDSFQEIEKQSINLIATD